jgi:nitrate/nitrite transporter NarK
MGAGDLLVRIGAVTFIVGAVGTLATVAPLLLGTRRLPTPAYFVSMLMGVGLAVALCGLLKAALSQRQGVGEPTGGPERAELS